MLKSKKVTRLFTLILCISCLAYLPKAGKSKVPESRINNDWSTLEIITAANISRLTNLRSINSVNGVITDLVSFVVDQSLYIGHVHENSQLYLTEANGSETDVQLLKSYSQPIVTDIAFSPAGNLLGVDSNNEISLWDTITGANLLSVDTEGVSYTLTFHPQSALLITGLFDRVVEWQLDPISQQQTFIIPGVIITDLNFASSGNILAVGNATGITLIDWQNQEELLAPITSTPNKEVMFNPEGTILAFMSETGYGVGLWKMYEDTLIMIKEESGRSHGNDIAFTADSLLLIASPEGLEIYDSAIGSYISIFSNFVSEVVALSISNDGRLLITGHVNGDINIWGVLPEIVCNFNPSTPNELIADITTANGTPEPDTICLTDSTYTFTTAHIPLNALPAITSEITIIGNGAALSRQAGSPLFGFFEVSAGGNLTLDNLTLSGGDVGNDTGGALVNNEGGTVTLNNVTFTNNHANTGGAIDNESGSLTLIDSTFENNQADYGGAIDNDTGGTLSISGSTFTSNTAELDGGAIHNDGGTLTVTDSTFTFNTAGRYGGALDNTGQATLSGSTFSGSAAAWSGGAVRNTNTLTLNNGSVLENNAATLGENNEGWGGGVYNTSSGTATISASTLSENAAIQGGGIRNHGDLTLNENTQLTGNSASSRGGGIYNAGGTITLTNSALLNNTAAGDGGAIYTTSLGSQVTISGSTLSGNTAGASGGAIRSSQGMTITDSVFSGNSATSNYGSLYLTSSSTTTAHNSCFSGNTATSVGHTGTTMQDFTGSWWGAADGPSGSGPGSGDAVNNRINFASFLTAGCPHP